MPHFTIQNFYFQLNPASRFLADDFQRCQIWRERGHSMNQFPFGKFGMRTPCTRKMESSVRHTDIALSERLFIQIRSIRIVDYYIPF